MNLVSIRVWGKETPIEPLRVSLCILLNALVALHKATNVLPAVKKK